MAGRQTFFESCGEKSAGWIDKITKTNKYNLWSVGYQHKKTTPESGICILQMFVTILTAGWYRPDCAGAIVTTTITTFLDIAITNMFAGPVQVFQTCMLVGTSLQSDMTAGYMQLLKTWEMAGCNCYRHG